MWLRPPAVEFNREQTRAAGPLGRQRRLSRRTLLEFGAAMASALALPLDADPRADADESQAMLARSRSPRQRTIAGLAAPQGDVSPRKALDGCVRTGIVPTDTISTCQHVRLTHLASPSPVPAPPVSG